MGAGNSKGAAGRTQAGAVPEAEEAAGALWPSAADGEMLTLKTPPHFTAEIKLINTHFEQYRNVGEAKLFWAKFQFPLWRQ